MNHPNISKLSQRARQAVALHLFQDYCELRELKHVEIERFVEYLWEFVHKFGDGGWFLTWIAKKPDLIETALGYEYPSGFEEFLQSAGVDAHEFRRVVEFTAEVTYYSMYAAASEKDSREMLYKLAEIVVPLGITWPKIERFATDSSKKQRWDWGSPLSKDQLTAWRKRKQPNPPA